MKLGAFASAVGIVDGLWTLVAGIYWTQLFAAAGEHGTGSNPGTMALGILIVVASAGCLVGPAEGLYGLVALAFVEVLGIAVFATDTGAAFYFTAVLGVATMALAYLGARKKTFVPEEDHPLNLPVFG